MGIENASVMEYGGNAASQLSTKFFLAGAESFGLGVNDPIEIEPGVPDVTAPVAKADSNGATGITFTIGSPDVAKLLPEVKATASDLQVVTLASQVPSALASSLGESAEGVRTVSSFPAQSSPLGQEYQEELNEFAGDPESIEFNDQALNIMSGYALFQQLVKGLKSVTGPEVIKALGEAGTMKDRAITYNPNTPPPLPSLPRIRNVLQYEGVVEGGQIESAQAKPFDPINSKLELGL
jgi:ABC-type branched-subunit amino acid transport system substrate-binding protein